MKSSSSWGLPSTLFSISISHQFQEVKKTHIFPIILQIESLILETMAQKPFSEEEEEDTLKFIV